MKCIVIDYGLGNLRSIQHKLEKTGVLAEVSRDPRVVGGAEAIILPGVGHFATGMENLRRAGLVRVLNGKAREERTPILGICLGMQLFAKQSEEGGAEGLGWINAVSRRFDKTRMPACCRVPHVGWNRITAVRKSELIAGVGAGQEFYFTHSYHVCCDDPGDVVATTSYGYEFASVIRRDNICGVQFHPEKSHEEGMLVVRNFIRDIAGRGARCRE